MGVPGLTRWVNSRVARRFDREKLAEGGGARLLFDAFAFSFWVLEKVEFEPHVGGNYKPVEDETKRLIKELIENHDVEAWFVFDGAEQTELKEEEKIERMKQRMEKFDDLKKTVKDVVAKRKVSSDTAARRNEEPELSVNDLTFEPSDLPLPPLFQDAVFAALVELSRQNENVMVLKADGEADFALSWLCRTALESGKSRCYICSNDSDFFVTQMVQFVPLASLNFSDCSGQVFTTDKLARCLNIDEDQLVNLAISIGTDYTEKKRLTDKQIDALLKRIRKKSKSIGRNSLSKSEREAKGIEYSRRMYQNQLASQVRPMKDLRVPTRALLKSTFPQTDCQLLQREMELLSSHQALQDRIILRLRLDRDSPTIEAKISRAAQEELLICFPEFAVALEEEPTENVSYWTAYCASFLYQVILKISLRGTCLTCILPSKVYDAKLFFPSPASSSLEQGMAKRGIQSKSNAGNKSEPRMRLPVDEHTNAILDAVERNRVTVITAETGAGKSSRVPFILLAKYPKAKLVVSQPRRVAANSLYERAKSELGKDHGLVGLRMGGGICKEVTNKCQVRYVTTGYLVRFLASRLEDLDIDFLILDEVHERSLDMDIVCRLAKSVLENNPQMRLILMSATVDASAFCEYFGIAEEPLFIGAKRFKNKEIFVRDLEPIVPTREFQKAKDAVVKYLGGMSVNRPPPFQFRRAQYNLCVKLILSYCYRTKSVLVFVSGIGDINNLNEELQPYENRLKVIAMHSSIPLEEQEEAWKETTDNRLKVIIATNTAESSITLPDLDVVICFGTAKKNQYDAKTRTNSLAEVWISQASAIQRAGRTGRLREGTVYRLYSEELFKQMPKHAPPEILESSLENAVVMAKGIFNGQAVRPWLEGLIDAPKDEDVKLSIENLAEIGILTSPHDEQAQLSSLGELVSRLPLDVSLSLLVANGAMLGCLSEAVALAAVLSIDRPPFIRASNIHHTPDKYNEIILRSKQTEWDISGGLYSEPLTVLRLLSLWNSIELKDRQMLANKKNISWPVMSNLVQVHKSLVGDVFRGQFGATYEDLELDPPDRLFRDPARLNRVRFVLFLACKSNFFQIVQPSLQSSSSRTHTGDFNHKLDGINVRDLTRWYSSIHIKSDVRASSITSILPPSSRWFAVREKTHVLGASSSGESQDFETRIYRNLDRLVAILASSACVSFVVDGEIVPEGPQPLPPQEPSSPPTLTQASDQGPNAALQSKKSKKKKKKKKKKTPQGSKDPVSTPASTPTSTPAPKQKNTNTKKGHVGTHPASKRKQKKTKAPKEQGAAHPAPAPAPASGTIEKETNPKNGHAGVKQTGQKKKTNTTKEQRAARPASTPTAKRNETKTRKKQGGPHPAQKVTQRQSKTTKQPGATSPLPAPDPGSEAELKHDGKRTPTGLKTTPNASQSKEQQSEGRQHKSPSAVLFVLKRTTECENTSNLATSRRLYDMWPRIKPDVQGTQHLLVFAHNGLLIQAFQKQFPNQRLMSYRGCICVQLKSDDILKVETWMKLIVQSWAKLLCLEILQPNAIEERVLETRHLFIGKNWEPKKTKLEQLFETKFDSISHSESEDQILLIENEYTPHYNEYRSLPFGVMGLGFLRRPKKKSVEFCATKMVHDIETSVTRMIEIPKGLLPKVQKVPQISIPLAPPRDTEPDEDGGTKRFKESNFCLVTSGIKQVTVQEQSICGLASCLDDGPIYAVAYSLLLMRKENAFMSSITVLPPGTEWTNKSLACIGGGSFDSNPDASTEPAVVRHALVSLRELPRTKVLRANKHAVAAMNMLFKEFTFVPLPLPKEYYSPPQNSEPLRRILKRGDPLLEPLVVKTPPYIMPQSFTSRHNRPQAPSRGLQQAELVTGPLRREEPVSVMPEFFFKSAAQSYSPIKPTTTNDSVPSYSPIKPTTTNDSVPSYSPIKPTTTNDSVPSYSPIKSTTTNDSVRNYSPIKPTRSRTATAAAVAVPSRRKTGQAEAQKSEKQGEKATSGCLIQ